MTIEKVALIKDRLRTAQSQQKSYADKRRQNLEFQVRDHVFLKVSLMKIVMRFGYKRKLSPRYVGPFEILERINTLAYRIALPLSLERIRNVFHVSTLRKFVHDSLHIVELEPLHLVEKLTYEEFPI